MHIISCGLLLLYALQMSHTVHLCVLRSPLFLLHVLSSLTSVCQDHIFFFSNAAPSLKNGVIYICHFSFFWISLTSFSFFFFKLFKYLHSALYYNYLCSWLSSNCNNNNELHLLNSHHRLGTVLSNLQIVSPSILRDIQEKGFIRGCVQ